MVNIDDARIASYSEDGYNFEILVDPDLALDIKLGNLPLENNLSKLLAIDEIYKNSNTGEKASEKSVELIFKTNDLKKIVEIILLKGHLDLTTEQKRKLALLKRKELIDYIVKNSINPITKLPHPVLRVENALEEGKIVIDSQKSIKSQIDKILEKLSEILPMDFKKIIIKVNVPLDYAGKVNGIINKYEVLERKWSNVFSFTVDLPAGEKELFMNSISGLTKGTAEYEFE